MRLELPRSPIGGIARRLGGPGVAMVRHDRNHSVSHRSYTPRTFHLHRIRARGDNCKTFNSLASFARAGH
jgi:hypothetical protein